MLKIQVKIIKRRKRTEEVPGSPEKGSDNFPSLPGGEPPKSMITKSTYIKPQTLTKFGETYETKPKHKKKVVQIVTNADKNGNESDEDITELIKESVKEALHKDTERPAHTSQAQKVPTYEEPV